jgi:hypothetical protein
MVIIEADGIFFPGDGFVRDKVLFIEEGLIKRIAGMDCRQGRYL